LATVATVMFVHGSVESLAYCYVAASLLGFLYYIPCLLRVLRDERLRDPSHFHRLRFPVRELWRYCGPLLSSHVVFLFPEGVAILFLEMLSDSIAVAEYRAVIPFARLNVVVQMSFSLLFMPLASRFLSRNEGEQIDRLYWDSVVWITVLTFPIFALTTVFSEPLAVLMLGPQYASASSVMALLAVAFFTEATLGLSSQTLRVYARIRSVVFSDLLATATGIVLLFLLIPRYGAFGAAVGSTAFRVVGHVGYMYFTHRATDVRTFAPRRLQIYFSAVLLLLVLVGARQVLQPGWAGIAVLIAVAWLGVFLWNRRGLAVGRVFPEIVRFPVLGRWFAERTPESVNDLTETA
jgi:O-antigen/teichoic acid export membrane protein